MRPYIVVADKSTWALMETSRVIRNTVNYIRAIANDKFIAIKADDLIAQRIRIDSGYHFQFNLSSLDTAFGIRLSVRFRETA